jgi:hypothetical protein
MRQIVAIRNLAPRPRLIALRAAFRDAKETGHKQVGLRRVAAALRLLDTNPAEAERLYWQAEFELPYAEAAR